MLIIAPHQPRTGLLISGYRPVGNARFRLGAGYKFNRLFGEIKGISGNRVLNFSGM
jgi:hypothetical protein